MIQIPRITQWLSHTNRFVFSVYAIIAAFATYFCMYAFRKPFTVGTFSEYTLYLPFGFELEYKFGLVIFQVMGYALSKFIGIKMVSEISAERRALAILILIGIAELALLGFALVPVGWNVVFLFFNGLPLGMVWGLVFGYLEGRKQSDALGAGLSVSYIVSSGMVKSVGVWVLSLGVSEFWMPAVTGALFFPVLLLFLIMLGVIPKPNKEDESLRTKRISMYGKERLAFFRQFGPGLVALTFLYMFLTAYRDFRDNFMADILKELQLFNIEIFTYTELPIALIVLVALGMLFLIKRNDFAFYTIHYLMIGGILLIGISTFALEMGWIGGITWMIMIGLGLYLGYVPYGCFLFDRLIAAVGVVATAGFMIYISDAFGYVGSIVLLFIKNAMQELAWLDFFVMYSYLTSLVCIPLFVLSLIYFKIKIVRNRKEDPPPPAGVE